MANDWRPISRNEDDYLVGALSLLQRTMEGYNRLSVAVLQGKMNRPTITASNLLGLHVYSFADFAASMANLLNPLASAFFFLRQVHSPTGSTNKACAYCLTVGARTVANGGLNTVALKAALADVCVRVRRDNTSANSDRALLELMHSGERPRFKPGTDNLQAAYNEFVSAGSPPRLASSGTIEVVYPWTDATHPENLMWFEIIEQ